MPDLISVVLVLIVVLFAVGGIATARHLRRRAEHRGKTPTSTQTGPADNREP